MAKLLISVFTMVGFPIEILWNYSIDFMSDLMQVFLHECGVVQPKTSPYLPQTNGYCKGIQRTLKIF